tara:strand:- start:882 stop:1247 length:366 start_codon:yes stop_codon:yes gene_type:complete
MKIEVSNGEIVDKLTILLIKEERISDEAKLANIKKEIAAISEIANSIIPRDDQLFKELLAVNKTLWDIENDIRDKDAANEFDEMFIHLARRVYAINDMRAEIKYKINKSSGSNLVEEKSYE